MLSPKKTKYRKQFKGRIHGVANVIAIDVSWAMPQRDSAAAVNSANVSASDTGDSALDRHVGDALGFFNRAPHRRCRRADIGYQSLAQPLRFRRAHGYKLHARVVHFSDDGARLRAAHIEGD